MKKLIVSALFILVALSSLTAAAQGRSVFFHRFTNGGGAVSSIPVTGPASAIDNVVDKLPNSSAGGLTSNGLGSLYFADYSNNKIFITDKAGKASEVVTVAAGLNAPQAVSYDSANKFLYIADTGNQRIVRANLSGAIPVNTVEVVVDNSQTSAILVTDIKYNSSDSNLYWATGSFIYRLAVNSVSLPASAPEQLTTQNSLLIIYFDFDGETPQNIYVADIGGVKGIYKAPVPSSGNSNIQETIMVDDSGDDNNIFLGLAADKESNTICFSKFTGDSQKLFCGSRSNPAAAIEISDNGILAAYSYLVIDKSPAIVTPATQPAPASVSVVVTGTKTQATIALETFIGAGLSNKANAVARLLRDIEAVKSFRAKKPAVIAFQYAVELKRPTDASGNPLPKKSQDIRKLTSKRNQLTVKNLKPNSNYEVKYRVEITSKAPGADPKVVKRTPLSPTTGFTVQ